MSEFKGTKGKWIADIRTGCCAVYPESRENYTNGCHNDDDRNIFYSSKGSNYNGNHWDIPDEEKANAILISKAPEMLEMLKNILEQREYGREYVSIENMKKLIKEATTI